MIWIMIAIFFGLIFLGAFLLYVWMMFQRREEGLIEEVEDCYLYRYSGKIIRMPLVSALIQIAVAFYHRQNQNLRGALALLQTGLEKITLHQPVFLGIELQEFVAQLEHCRTELLRLGEEECKQFREEMIPRLQFVHG